MQRVLAAAATGCGYLVIWRVITSDADVPGHPDRDCVGAPVHHGAVDGAACVGAAARRTTSRGRSGVWQVVLGELLTLVLIGVGTYAMRAASLVTARRQPPALVARLLTHLGPAVLAAITLLALAPRGSVSIADTMPAGLGATMAAVAWRRTGSPPVALFGGMAVWWLASWALSAL